MKYCPTCAKELIEAVVDDRTRKRCPDDSCGYVFFENPTPIVAAIVEHDGRVILARNHGWAPGMFGLVTGFLEKGESPDEGVLREVKEELGLDGEIVSFVGYYPFHQMNQLILAFHIEGRGDIILGDELADIRLVEPERLKPWPFGTGFAVRDWLDNRSE